jgi:hypothetical protein
MRRAVRAWVNPAPCRRLASCRANASRASATRRGVLNLGSFPPCWPRLAASPRSRGWFMRPVHRLSSWPARRPGALSQFLSHSPASGGVHQCSLGSCLCSSRTVADAGERGPALLESVLGQPLGSSNLPSSATLTCDDALGSWSHAALPPQRLSHFLSQFESSPYASFRTNRCAGTLRWHMLYLVRDVADVPERNRARR